MMGMHVYNLFCFLYPLPRGLRTFGTRTQFFPRGMGASIIPFGRDRQKIHFIPKLIVQLNFSVSRIWLTRPCWTVSQLQRGIDTRVN